MIKESGIVERLREMPSSLNDALRCMEEAATLITELQDKVERLTERCSAHEGQVKWGSETIDRLQSCVAELQAENARLSQDLKDRLDAWVLAMQGKLAAESSLHRVRAWQPIETAPKDGTAILIETKAHANGVVVATWLKYNGKEAFRDWDMDPHFPTHWMLLPAPPAVADTNADAPGNVGLVSEGSK